jgi:TetR/AcrR family transcriptional regulator, transcriptional repressor for nem operon
MPWEKKYDESAVLERAMRAFWARGYEATSMSDLVEATGINRGSIYAAFTDKRTLFIRALRHYDRIHRANYLQRIAASHAPKDAIVAAFESAGRNTARGGRPGGCLLVNTALELSPHDSEVRALVGACVRQVEQFFFAMIEAAKKQGTIRRSVASRRTAQALLGLFLGLRVLTRSNPDKTAVHAITSQARMMLE